MQLGGTLDLEELLSLVLSRLTTLVQAERALCALFDRQGEVQRAVAYNLDWPGPGHPLPVSQGIIQSAREQRRPFFVADAANDADFGEHQSVRMLGLRFMVAVPLLNRGTVIGVLYADSRAGEGFGLEAHAQLLTALARIVTTAIENARLFEEQRFRTRLLAALVHDLRTPLAAVAMNSQMLAGEPGLSAEAGEMIEDLNLGALRLKQQIEHALSLSTAQKQMEAPQRVDVGVVLSAPIRALRSLARDKGLRIALRCAPQLPSALTVPERLLLAVENLVNNALRHGISGSTITIELTVRPDAGPTQAVGRARPDVDLFAQVPALKAAPDTPYIQISVHNIGKPIPDSLLPTVFDPFVSGRPEGTGLGLSIVDQCTRNLGGIAWVESTAAEGTRFSISLPTQLIERIAPQRTPHG